MTIQIATPTPPTPNSQTEDAITRIIDLRPPFSLVGETFVLDGTHVAVVFGPDHPLVDDLIELEVQQLIALGDNEAESRAWLADRTGAAWVGVFVRDDPQDRAHVLGLMRVTGPQSNASNRLLRDLAVLRNCSLHDLEVDIEQQLGGSLRPFCDITTLDLTPVGSATLRESGANAMRLFNVVGIITGILTDRDEVVRVLGLMIPEFAKGLKRIFFPLWEATYGDMAYRLTEENTNPIMTRLIGLDGIGVREFMAGPSHHSQRLCRTYDENDLALKELTKTV